MKALVAAPPRWWPLEMEAGESASMADVLAIRVSRSDPGIDRVRDY